VGYLRVFTRVTTTEYNMFINGFMWVNNNTTLPNMTQITIFITIVLPTLFHLKIRIIDDYSGIVVNNGDLTKNNSFFYFYFLSLCLMLII
jgi:hypothetical protein